MGMIDNICNLLGVTFQSCNNLEMKKKKKKRKFQKVSEDTMFQV